MTDVLSFTDKSIGKYNYLLKKNNSPIIVIKDFYLNIISIFNRK